MDDHPLSALINARITAAREAGEFDNLSGAGKPLPQIEDPEGEVFNRMLRDAGAVPEFVALARELANLRAPSCRRPETAAVGAIS